jgi:hypothetical protein
MPMIQSHLFVDLPRLLHAAKNYVTDQERVKSALILEVEGTLFELDQFNSEWERVSAMEFKNKNIADYMIITEDISLSLVMRIHAEKDGEIEEAESGASLLIPTIIRRQKMVEHRAISQPLEGFMARVDALDVAEVNETFGTPSYVKNINFTVDNTLALFWRLLGKQILLDMTRMVAGYDWAWKGDRQPTWQIDPVSEYQKERDSKRINAAILHAH